MKRLLAHIGFVCFCIVSISCSKEEAVPVIVDFDISIVNEDYSVPVEVVMINATEGAEEYQWTFEGGSPETSVRRNPGTILFNEAGEYTITLYAFNRDGSEDQKEITIDLDVPVGIDFTATHATDNFAPATVNLENNSFGANTYVWTFEGGTPLTSDQQHPGAVVFDTPGDHAITLTIDNGRETYTKDTIITVAPYLVADFDWEVDFQDRDLQVPVQLTLQNLSTSATSYLWSFGGGTPATSTEEHPTVVFNSAGQHTITLQATNGKETKTISAGILLEEDTNIKVFEDIQFGIAEAHNDNEIGAFFSAYTEEIYTASEVTEDNGALIDLVFFGLNSGFSFNRFYAPDTLDDTTLEDIPNATHTKIINVQEDCDCDTSLSVTQFDAMTTDSLLKELTIVETSDGLQPFDNSVFPRVVLFETADGRKGALKIKSFISNGDSSYINTDIKIQKLAN